LYTRLSCLTLIDATSLAAQEVKALEDLNARTYIDDATGEHLVPWELRVLNVRLQALGFGDSRRAVMSYHELAREAREHISKAMSRHDNSARELWKARLHDLGIKVAGALIEMDDLAGASHHLASLPHKGDSKLALSKALLWLQLGDADRARGCAKETVGGAEEAENAEILITALCDMADGEYEASLANWERLQDLDDEMVATNTAVCLLYLGRMPEVRRHQAHAMDILTNHIQGRTILEKQIEAGRTSHTLLFNLSTMYELCTEKNRALKMKLAEKVAGMNERPSGWEKSNSDFKL
jgi:tetratricopeptide (TPR) repeat protein